MDIHRPKTAHSVREFLIEIATIICGILIALGLEQVVEAVHRDAEVREAREALTDEMQENVGRLRETLREYACLEPQLQAYATWAKGGPKPHDFRFFEPLIRTSTWESVKTTVAPKMPLAERMAQANFYDQLSNAIRNRELQIALHMTVLKYNDLATLSPAQRDGLLETVSQERQFTHKLAGNVVHVIEMAAAVGVKDAEHGSTGAQVARVRAGIDWVCGKTTVDPFDGRH